MANDPQTAPAKAAPVKKFRVLHAAVSGLIPDPKKPGQTREHDFYTGSVVTDAQLDGNAAQYLIMGAIEPLD